MRLRARNEQNEHNYPRIFNSKSEIGYRGHDLGGKLSVGTFVVPATTEVTRQMKETNVKVKSVSQNLEEVGCRIGDASCAACLGGPSDTFGRLNDVEVCISSTNRNFPGRMGSKKSQVYLASPYTVAASALTGVITHPREFVN